MSEPVFVIRNQHGLYLTRQNEWVDGHDAAPLFKTPFRDVALNTLIELNAKDVELRGILTEVELNEKGLPQVMPCDVPSPVAESSADATATEEASLIGQEGKNVSAAVPAEEDHSSE